MKPGALLFRADADVSIGTGHVMRCLALAEAWHDCGGRTLFAMNRATPAIADRLREEGIGVARVEAAVADDDDSAQTIAIARKENASWVITDGYKFGSHYQQTLTSAGIRTLSLDDTGGDDYAADFILNQNIHAHEDLYRNRSPRTKLLLGTRYALLRREFGSLTQYRREVPAVARRLLVTMGGSDPDNRTSCILDALDEVCIPGLEAVIVAGGSNPHASALAARLASRNDRRFVSDAKNMPELIANADLAISAAGTVCWEYCYLGLPALLLPIAENQVAVARALHAAGAAELAVSDFSSPPTGIAQQIVRLVNSRAERLSLSQNARALVDGQGVKRTLEALCNAGPA